MASIRLALFNPALRATAPREHHQASQASARYDCTNRASVSYFIIALLRINFLSTSRSALDDSFHSDFNASPHYSLLTDCTRVELASAATR
jgi:hypothetical protein